MYWISPHRRTDCGNMTSYQFLKMAVTTAKYYFRFRICWCHCLQKVKVYQESKFRRIYLILRLRYNYFRLWKTNVHHIEILLPVLISTIRRNRRVILHPAAEFRPNRNIRRGNMTSYRFSRWRPPAMYLLWSNGGHPRYAFRVLNSFLKSLLRRINSSGDIAM